MPASETFDQFSQWHESCLERGADPPEVALEMGGMVLIGNEELIQQLEEEGKSKCQSHIYQANLKPQ